MIAHTLFLFDGVVLVLAAGFVGGVWFAAWRQTVIEREDDAWDDDTPRLAGCPARSSGLPCALPYGHDGPHMNPMDPV